MYHLIIVVVGLLAAAPPALTIEFDTVTNLLNVVDLRSCLTAPGDTDVDVLNMQPRKYYVYHRSVPTFCCGIVQFNVNNILGLIAQGDSTFVNKANCSGAQGTQKFTTVGLGLGVFGLGEVLPIGINQFILINPTQTYVALLTVLKQYEEYNYIFTQTCLFAVTPTNSTFAGNTYNTWGIQTGLASPFDIPNLNEVYGTNLIAVQNPSGCT